MIFCKPFDVYCGKQIMKYTLADIISVDVVTLGATIIAINVPNNCGTTTDVALAYTTAQGILSGPYMGAVVGRCGNRIAQGKFTLEGKTYQLAKNNGEAHLHGGAHGFNQKVYSARVEGDTLCLSCSSPDGDENYPSKLDWEVHYTVSGSKLTIEYFAASDGTTIFNPTNHTYFNLDGQDAVNNYDNVVQIFADKYLPVDADLIPTGELRDVKNTAFDFTAPKPIGKDINNGEEQQLVVGGGFDHNFCLNGTHAARAYSPKTGIVMDCYTDRCGMQFYSGNFLNNEQGKSVYNRHAGFCFETQLYPNAINQPEWQSPVLKRGERFYSKTEYVFSVSKQK